MKPLNHQDLEPIIEAVRLAAALCREVQDHFLVGNEKTDREPVTIADYGSQAIICRAIRQHFPADAIIAEERGDQFLSAVSTTQRETIEGLVSQVLGETVSEADMLSWLDHGRDKEAERTWVIDPIDGTIGFLAKRTYTIAIGVLEHGLAAAAVMGCPGYGDGKIFYAAQGKGYEIPLQGEGIKDVAVAAREGDAVKVVESYESSHADHGSMKQVYLAAGWPDVEPIRLDGQDKYAMVGCGDADLYLRISPKPEYRAKIWDHVAGTVMVTAGGGTVTDESGMPLDFSQGYQLPPSRVVVASNGRIHAQVLDALKRLGF